MGKENLMEGIIKEGNFENQTSFNDKEYEQNKGGKENQEINFEEKENNTSHEKVNLKSNSDECGESSEVHVKTSEDEEERKGEFEVGSEEWFKEDQKKFKSAYPDLNSEELFSDPIFLAFAEKRAGVESMVDIYGTYLSISRKIEAKVMEKAEREFKTRLANAKASPGSLTDGSVAQDRLFSIEELKRMSPEAIERNWEKVQKSMKAFGK